MDIKAIDTLLECMNWLGLDYDEEVLYQTTQAQHHLDAAKKLLDEGNAYHVGPTPEHSPVYFRIPYCCDDYPFVRTVGDASIALAPSETIRNPFESQTAPLTTMPLRKISLRPRHLLSLPRKTVRSISVSSRTLLSRRAANS